MSSHAPYIMPDGGKLGDGGGGLRRSEMSNVKRSGTVTGKQAQADLVSLLASRARSKVEGGGTLASGQELVELKALESVGVRRRRRW